MKAPYDERAIYDSDWKCSACKCGHDEVAEHRTGGICVECYEAQRAAAEESRREFRREWSRAR